MSSPRPAARFSGWTGLLAALVLGVPRSTLYLQARRFGGLRLLSAAWFRLRFPLAYALWRECRSLPFRIAEMHEKGLATEGLNLGAPLRTLAPGSYEEDVFYQLRNEGISNLRQRRPWSGPLDGLIYLEGLAAAANYRVGTCRSSECVGSPLSTSREDRALVNWLVRVADSCRESLQTRLPRPLPPELATFFQRLCEQLHASSNQPAQQPSPYQAPPARP